MKPAFAKNSKTNENAYRNSKGFTHIKSYQTLTDMAAGPNYVPALKRRIDNKEFEDVYGNRNMNTIQQ